MYISQCSIAMVDWLLFNVYSISAIFSIMKLENLSLPFTYFLLNKGNNKINYRICVRRRVSYKKQELIPSSTSTRVHPPLLGGVCLAHLFRFFLIILTIMCLYYVRSVLWCSLRYSHKTHVRFVFTSSCL